MICRNCTNMFAAIDLQGFTIDKKFHPKEVAIKINNQINYFLLRSRKSYRELSCKEKTTVNYLEEKHFGIPYDLGFIDYSNAQQIIKDTVSSASIVYVKGSQKCKYMKTVLDDIIVVDITYCENTPKLDRNIPTCTNHKLTFCACALRNVDLIYKWAEKSENNWIVN